MKSGFRATRSPFVNILAFFNVVASRQISPHRACKGTMFIHICKIFLLEFRGFVVSMWFLDESKIMCEVSERFCDRVWIF